MRSTDPLPSPEPGGSGPSNGLCVLDDVLLFSQETQLECHGFCGVGGVGGLLVLRASLVAPTEADVRRLGIPAEAARQLRSLGILHVECFFVQNKHSVKRSALQSECNAPPAPIVVTTDDQRPAIFPDVLPNSRGFRHISKANVRQNVTTEAFWKMPGRVSALLCLVAPQAVIHVESRRLACHTCPHTPFRTPIFYWMKSHRSEPLRTVNCGKGV